MSDGAKCPKCGNHTLEFGYGLCGGGIGAYSFCTTDGCEYFDKTPDPELSTPDEIAAHQEAIDRARSAKMTEPTIAHTDHPMRHYDRTCPACNTALPEGE